MISPRIPIACSMVAAGLIAASTELHDEKRPPMTQSERRDYWSAIEQTANMVRDPEAQRLAHARGLNVLNLTWEDTGRYKNSAVGPNISDMTIQVATDASGKGYQVKCMPVIRHPNFSDESTDIDPRDFTMLVGNEDGRSLKRISLYEFLERPTDFLSNPRSWRSSVRTLLAPRDEKVLVSAQAAFLPVPKRGIATFNPVLFNYQSVSGDPAVLTILATREGTSVTIIDNKRDAFAEGAVWGQRLFHNERGMRASLTGQRESDFNRLPPIGPGEDDPPASRPQPGKKKANLNMVLLIQVPLKQKFVGRGGGIGGYAPMAAESNDAAYKSKRGSDVENAIIGHGELEGPFTEIDNLAIERDQRFPVRVTVQFYKATSNGVVNAADLDAIKGSIDKIYSRGDTVGSLVTGGDTGRITEYDGAKIQPTYWWSQFWNRYESDMGVSRHEAMRRLRKMLGRDPYQCRVTELYLRDKLRT